MKCSASAIAVIAAMHAATASQAGEVCYGFDNQTEGQLYYVGDTFVGEHLKVTIQDYELNGVKAEPGSVLVRGASIAKGRRAPEMYSNRANMLIEPREPVAEITFRIGDHQTGPGGGNANIGVNGSRHEVIGGLSRLDGHLIGAPGRRARIHIETTRNQTEDGQPGDWRVGKMRVRAVDGKIESLLIGGRPGIIDDVCLSTERP